MWTLLNYSLCLVDVQAVQKDWDKRCCECKKKSFYKTCSEGKFIYRESQLSTVSLKMVPGLVLYEFAQRPQRSLIAQPIEQALDYKLLLNTNCK